MHNFPFVLSCFFPRNRFFWDFHWPSSRCSWHVARWPRLTRRAYRPPAPFTINKYQKSIHISLQFLIWVSAKHIPRSFHIPLAFHILFFARNARCVNAPCFFDWYFLNSCWIARFSKTHIFGFPICVFVLRLSNFRLLLFELCSCLICLQWKNVIPLQCPFTIFVLP